MSDVIDPRALIPEDPREPTGELLREAIEDAAALARLEVALARQEITAEIAHVRAGAMALGVAYSAALSGVTLLLVGLALAVPGGWIVALVIGALLLLGGAASALYGWRSLPKNPMGETRDRLETDLRQLRERVA